jgi:hypothetical protein
MNPLEKPKLLRVPVKCPNKEFLIGTLSNLDDDESLVVLIEDKDGVWMMTLDGVTTERINWMLDRTKLMIHKAD